MNNIILVFFVVILNTAIFAQAPVIQWSKTFGGDSSDVGYSIQQTDDGGYIIAGTTWSFGAGDSDVWLIRTDSYGDTLWTQTYGEGAADAGASVRQTSNGGYIIAATTWSFGAGASDIWLIRTDSSGDTLWTQTFGKGGGVQFSGRESVSSADMISDGGYIIAGNWDTGNSYFSGNMVLIKTNSNGDSLWMRHFGANGSPGVSAQQTADGGYIIAGNWPGVILIKTDANGDTLWTNLIIESGELYGSTSLQQTSDGGYILCGGVWSSGNAEVILIKTDDNGETLWINTFGGSNQDYAHSVQQTTDGGYILCGYSWSYPNAKVILIKADANGDTLWTLNPVISGIGHSVQQTTDGGYIIVGKKDRDVLLIKVAPDITSIDENQLVSEYSFQLQQNYPNPFNPFTTIKFQIPNSEFTTLKVYNILGKKVSTLVSKRLNQGKHTYTFDGNNLASGIYYYQLVAGEYREVRKMILLK
jgi:hypothetical protein